MTARQALGGIPTCRQAGEVGGEGPPSFDRKGGFVVSSSIEMGSMRPSSFGKTLVLVTNQFQCERIIQAGRRIANITSTQLLVFSVQNPDYDPTPEAMEYLFRVSKEYDAVMNVLYSQAPEKALVDYIKEERPTHILTGMPQQKGSVLHKLWKKFPHITFFTVDQEGSFQEVLDRQNHEIA